MDERHAEYTSKFWSLNDSVTGQNQLSASLAEQVKELKLTSDSTSSIARDALKFAKDTRAELRHSASSTKFIAQEARDIALAAREALDTSSTPRDTDDDMEAPLNTSSIDAAFATADAVIHSGLAGLESKVSSLLNRATTRPREVHPDAPSTPARHPRFSAVQDVWSGKDHYDSDAAYNARHHNLSPDDISSTKHDDSSYHSSPDRGIHPSPDRGDRPGNVPPGLHSAYTRRLEPHILTWHAGSLGGNPITGTDFMEDSDVEALDISGPITIDIAECHYDIDRIGTTPDGSNRTNGDTLIRMPALLPPRPAQISPTS